MKSSIQSRLGQLPAQFPLLPYFFGYLSGIGFALTEMRDYLTPGILPLLLLSFSIYLALIASKQGKYLRISGLIFLGLFGYLQSDISLPEKHIHNLMKEGEYAQVEGILWAMPTQGKDRIVYNIRLERIAYKGKWRKVTGMANISLYTNAQSHWRAGDILLFKKIKLKRPRNFKNPGRFDYQRFLRLRGIDITGGTSRPDSIEKTGVAQLPFWVDLRENIREKIYFSIDNNLSEQEAALLRAMVFGDKSGLSDELREAFASTGVGHLTAVSGLHIGFVAGFALLLFRPVAFAILWRWFPAQARNGMAPKLAALSAIVPVSIYMLLAGDKASALRAGFMVLAILLALLVDREKNAANALLLVGFLILLNEPEVILDAGFQMSFMAVASILFVLRQISQREQSAIDRMGEPEGLDRWLGLKYIEDPDHSTMQRVGNQILRLFSASTLISLAAILGTLPIVLFHFHRISLSGFLLNPLITPLASLLIPLALAVAMLAIIFPALAFFFFWPIKILMVPFLTIPLWISEKPWSALYWPSPGPLWSILWYAFLFAGIKILMDRKPISRETLDEKSPLERKGLLAWLISCLLISMGFLWPQYSVNNPSDQLSVTMLDVGQGESIFIRYPNGQTMMIDGGGFYKNSLDVGKRVVAPYLWHRRIRKIDYMIASHSDNDHISGLESLIDLFPVSAVLAVVDPQFKQTRRARRWVAKAKNKGIPLLPLEIGRPIKIGEASITPLHPDKTYLQRLKSSRRQQRIANNLSLVLKLEYRQFSMLLTGDIESDAEDYLQMKNTSLKADYLKAAHHGSRNSNSTEFITAVSPKGALFSSGYLNWARHPHPKTLARYEKSGARIWRTDRDGAITLNTNGTETTVVLHPDL